MAEYLVFLPYLVPIVLLVGGGLVGWRRERDHYASIEARESQYARQPMLNSRTLPAEAQSARTEMVTGSVVISIDRFKQFLGALRGFFGGEINAYASLIDRARREAVLRMREQALGADIIVNLKMETASLSKGGEKQMGTVEVLAYGTAVWYSDQPPRHRSIGGV
ncbi:YbjQ family protein [Acanthopleuribacter pedis]|uniref:Heavy metal-binding domain-containing protein n=1 Tax=Acanthopleuribacter pedis TaxID=442870 RepID=A0A8J7U5J8_9BACT|nr:heavy metal-binding domain-containing protein [Acanthopleuribacter pedis]MBO1322638.1 heavy metal-binding domain-containing protein [Acanthopleuribacter pedis]